MTPADWKMVASVGRGVREIRIHEQGEFRVVYVAKFPEAVYILHAFEKKTQRVPKQAIELARRRCKAVLASRTKA